ncbi:PLASMODESMATA CALLOSE-BINDING PROTEIN 3 [Brachypodium distachyon]|uniref:PLASMODESMATA CALLOSE-BINDING PROTEIN 3 n=1 Tax=Brachypodium distachyon TaxID=15368 RepID=UPI00052FEAA0|nr:PLASMODESMATA CALLOSE-BINDING PROTEIN 3 [Brachypodium distachyon]|eukprot:XP_010229693.1 PLASMODESMATA CALLOSE-BINDING PROTEIN 3 [Brachypodium distachyon]
MASDAARLLLLLAVAAALAGRSEGGWCVCRPDLPDAALQKTLDYACGGGADCKPILQNGACFSPDTVKAHCSYAVNSFYQRSGQNPQACAFSGTAFLSNNDPGSPGCPYPSTPSPPGVDGPPTAQGPSSFNDTSGAGILPVTGTVIPMVLLACSLLVALCFRL